MLQANRQERTCYGRELWDCLPVLEQNTQYKSQQIENTNVFFAALRTAFDTFAHNINLAAQNYRRTC